MYSFALTYVAGGPHRCAKNPRHERAEGGVVTGRWVHPSLITITCTGPGIPAATNTLMIFRWEEAHVLDADLCPLPWVLDIVYDLVVDGPNLGRRGRGEGNPELVTQVVAVNLKTAG